MRGMKCGNAHWMCQNTASLQDYYGETFDRHVCHDESASVIVRTVDTCQCTYPDNHHSNKRWCCGDLDHLDLSLWCVSVPSLSPAHTIHCSKPYVENYTRSSCVSLPCRTMSICVLLLYRRQDSAQHACAFNSYACLLPPQGI